MTGFCFVVATGGLNGPLDGLNGTFRLSSGSLASRFSVIEAENGGRVGSQGSGVSLNPGAFGTGGKSDGYQICDAVEDAAGFSQFKNYRCGCWKEHQMVSLT